MDLKALFQAASATRKPIAREFEFEGQQIVCHFLDLSAGEVRAALGSANPDAALVAASACNAEGALMFTPAEAEALRYWAQRTLAREALVAVGFTREAKEATKKDSPPTLD